MLKSRRSRAGNFEIRCPKQRNHNPEKEIPVRGRRNVAAATLKIQLVFFASSGAHFSKLLDCIPSLWEDFNLMPSAGGPKICKLLCNIPVVVDTAPVAKETNPHDV